MVYVIGQEEIDAVTQVLTDQRLDRYIDPKNSFTSVFEKSFASKIEVQHAMALSSGTSALICGLVGMNVSSGDEVLIPAHTYIATAQAVKAVGAKPILCEVDETLTICPADLNEKLSSKTKAIIPVHMHGLPCNMTQVTAFAKEHGLGVLEDVAQACGGAYDQRRLGSIGDAGAFSFNHHKILSCGEGGALTTNSTELYQRAYLYHDGGCVYESEFPNLGDQAFSGVNFRISEVSSSLLVAQLQRLDDILEALRAEYRLLCGVLNGSMRPIPLNDEHGQCGRFLFITLPSATDAQDLLHSAKESHVTAVPASTPGHVCADWLPLISEFNHQPCPKTLEVVERTIGIPTQVTRPDGELDRTMEWLNKISVGYATAA